MSAEKHPAIVLIGIIGAAATALAAIIALPRGCSENKKAAEEARRAEVQRLADEEDLKKKLAAQPNRPAPVPPAPKGKAPVPNPVEPPVEPPTPPRKSKRVPAEVTQPSAALSGGFQARLTESLLEGDELVCTAFVTQIGTGAQRTMKFEASGGPKVTLPDGTRVKCSSIEIAGRTLAGTTGSVQFDKDVPLKFVMRFRAVPPTTTKLAHLDLGFSGKFDLTFRDAPVQQLVAE